MVSSTAKASVGFADLSLESCQSKKTGSSLDGKPRLRKLRTAKGFYRDFRREFRGPIPASVEKSLRHLAEETGRLLEKYLSEDRSKQEGAPKDFSHRGYETKVGGSQFVIIFSDDGSFDILEKLGRVGEGGDSTVERVHQLGTGKLKAMKVAKEDHFSRGAIKNEVHFLKKIHSNGIMRGCQSGEVTGFFLGKCHAFTGLLYSGDLKSYIKKEGGYSVQKLRQQWQDLHPVITAMAELHRNGIVHLDLKPRNLFLKGGAPLISDFGAAVYSS